MPDQNVPSVDPIREQALHVAAKTHFGRSADVIAKTAAIYESYLRLGQTPVTISGNASVTAMYLSEAAMSAVNLSAVNFEPATPSAPAEYVPGVGWPERGASPTPFACIERSFETAARVFYFGSVEQALEERGSLAAHYPGTEWRVFIQL